MFLNIKVFFLLYRRFILDFDVFEVIIFFFFGDLFIEILIFFIRVLNIIFNVRVGYK